VSFEVTPVAVRVQPYLDQKIVCGKALSSLLEESPLVSERDAHTVSDAETAREWAHMLVIGRSLGTFSVATDFRLLT
jgi:hypothetical protein